MIISLILLIGSYYIFLEVLFKFYLRFSITTVVYVTAKLQIIPFLFAEFTELPKMEVWKSNG